MFSRVTSKNALETYHSVADAPQGTAHTKATKAMLSNTLKPCFGWAYGTFNVKEGAIHRSTVPVEPYCGTVLRFVAGPVLRTGP